MPAGGDSAVVVEGNLELDGRRNEAAAWYHPDPSPMAAQIDDHVAFWHGVRVVPVEEG